MAITVNTGGGQTPTSNNTGSNVTTNVGHDSSSDTTGILGAILGGLAGLGVGIATSWSGPGSIAAAMAAAGVGSAVGNVLEEVALDYAYGRDPKISFAEFKGMLDNIGIDMIPVPGGGGVVFKIGGKVIGGTLGRMLKWVASFVVPKAGVAVNVLETIAKRGNTTAQILRKGSQDISDFLTDAGFGTAWTKAIRSGAGRQLRGDYQRIWGNAYKKAAELVRKDPVAVGLFAPGEVVNKTVVDAVVNKLTTAGKMITQGGKGRQVTKLTDSMSDDVLNLIIGAADEPLTAWVNRIAKEFNISIPAHLTGKVADQILVNEGQEAATNYNQGGNVTINNEGGSMSPAREQEILDKIHNSGVFTALIGWLELCFERIEETTGKTQVTDQASYLIFTAAIKGTDWMVQQGFPPIPDNVASLFRNIPDILIYVLVEGSQFIPWLRPFRTLVPKRVLWAMRIWFWVTVFGEGAAAALLEHVGQVDKQLASELSAKLGVIEQLRPSAAIGGVLGDMIAAGQHIYDAFTMSEDEAKADDAQDIDDAIHSTGDSSNPSQLWIHPTTLEVRSGPYPGQPWKKANKGGKITPINFNDGGLLNRIGVSGYNKPKRTPSHPTKSHVVVAKEGDKTKTIRFGQQGVSGAGANPTSKSEKARQKSFKARHKKNIKKGKMSAAYWADKVKW